MQIICNHGMIVRDYCHQPLLTCRPSIVYANVPLASRVATFKRMSRSCTSSGISMCTSVDCRSGCKGWGQWNRHRITPSEHLRMQCSPQWCWQKLKACSYRSHSAWVGPVMCKSPMAMHCRRRWVVGDVHRLGYLPIPGSHLGRQ